MSDLVADKLKKIGPRTIDRLLKKPKQQMKIRGTSGTKPVRLLNRAIPIVTWFDYARLPSTDNLKKDKDALRLKGKSCTKPVMALKSRIPLRTFYSSEKRKTPGFIQIDQPALRAVHHCGQSTSGEYADLWSDLTLTATDIYSG